MGLITKAQAVTNLGAGGVVNPTPQEVADWKYFNDKIETGRVNSAILNDKNGWRTKNGQLPEAPYYTKSSPEFVYYDANEIGIVGSFRAEWQYRHTDGNSYDNLYMINNLNWDRAFYFDTTKSELQFGMDDNLWDGGNGRYEYPTYTYLDDYVVSQGETVKKIVIYDAETLKLTCALYLVDPVTNKILKTLIEKSAFYWAPDVATDEIFCVGELRFGGTENIDSNIILSGDLKPITLEDAGTAYPDVDEAVAKMVTRMGDLTIQSGSAIYKGTAKI